MMTVESITRRCWSQALAAAILSGGIWYVALHSTSSDLAAARAELAAQRVLLNEGKSEPGTTRDTTETALHGQESRFESLIRESPEPERLYDAIVAAARACSVRIERLNPSRNTTRGREIETKTGVAVATIDFTMEFRGEYAGAVRFLHEIETGLGMVRVNTLRLAPERTGDGGLIVVANIETSHFKPQTIRPNTEEKPRS